MYKYPIGVVLCIFLTCRVLFAAGNQSPPIFATKEWREFSPPVEYVIMLDHMRIVFLGEMREYQNPADTREHIRTIAKHTALVSVRNTEVDLENFSTVDVDLYYKKRVTEALDEVKKNEDIVGYTRWRTVPDPRTGEDILASLESWLRGTDGVWVYGGERKISEEIVTKPVTVGNKRIMMLVGIKFTLASAHVIFRFDPTLFAFEQSPPLRSTEREKP